MKKIITFSVFLFLVLSANVLMAQAPAYQGIVYVTVAGAGNHSGDSWANAVSSIDSAQTIAQANNAVVWVAAGTYYGDITADNAFTMYEGVNVYGGFAGNEPANYDLSLRDFNVNATILDGQDARRVLYQPSSFYNQTTWDGFTIRNGNASYGYGGGVYIQNGGLLSHCKITNNSAYYSGSGVYAYNATITHCEINGNNSNGSSGSGGGLYASNTTITHCEIIGNNSNGTGGGIYAYSSIVKDCHIEGNTSRSTAGGIYASSSTVRECRIEGNNSGSSGGGVSSSGGIVVNCWITRNQSSYSGGGIVISNTGIRNCLVANNSVIGTSSSNNGGGGISGSGTVVNTTIVHNSSKGDGAGVNGSASTSLSNCIVWGNEQNGMSNNLNGSSIVCSNCAVENGYPGTRMVFLDNNTISMFVNPSLSAGASDSTLNVNWHLQQGSVCVNRGNNSMAEDSLDLDGTLRIKRDTVDIGCYESDYYSVPMTIYDSIIYVTVTGSGTHSGNSWANATSSIWEAQTLAQTYDAVVWVAGGTYYGDTTSVNAFTMRDGVSVYGGFAGNEPANYDLSLRDFETNATVLDGQNARRVLYQPFQFNKEMEWNGFTIRNGKSSDYGGGVYLRKNSRLSYCKVLNNISTGSIGGGIYCTNSYVANCEIRNNNIMHEYPMGGGVYSAQSTIQNCVVSENVCRYGSYGEGGGIYAYSSIIKGCTLRNNKSESGGGGVYARTNTSVMNCVIRNNESGDLGGGIYASAASVSNCEITNNKTTGSRYAYGGGGGIYSASSEIINCLISNNTSKSHYGGGGINISNTTISNSTVTRNNITGSAKGSGIYVHENTYSDLSNCIVWGNENIDNTGDSEQIYGHIDGLNSAVEGGYPGTGMVLLYHNDGNPLFLNPSLTSGADDSTANVDWHLQQGSLCINSGDNSLVTDSLDLDGTARIKRDTVDLGCYESDYYSTPVTEYDSIIYVTVTGAGTHSGNSWVNATSSIDMAQLLAQTYNAVVWVAAGTYYGDTTSANAFTMRDGVNVFGGFVGNEPANFDLSQRNFEANATVLDGQNARRVLYQPFSFYAQATWDGFTIQNGQISGEGGGVYLNENGALSCCVIRNNTANNNNGGGVRMYRSKVSNCLIIENKAVSNSNGGNIYGGRGGGVYVYDGAGVCTICPGNSLIIQCKILNNTAYSGAGVAGEDSYISNCLISNNTATQTGGGISGGRTVINTTIVRNVSGGDGAGVLSNNNTKLKNCIVWGNERNGASGSISGTFTCSYSAVEGGADGDSNIMLGDVNPPFFVNPSFTAGAFDSTANVDWHLQAGSPCINRGDNSVVTDSLDLDGMARIKNDIVDIGCYESDYSIAPVVEYDSIIYVTVTGAGTHSGNSWANAVSSIEEAQALAQTYGAVVWVAAGTYYGDTSAANAFTMRDGLSVYGGFAGNESADYDLSQRNFEVNTTILDGQNVRRVLYQPSEFYTVAEWNGFTIQNGQASGAGGGAFLHNNGILKSCIIINNTATGNGAGVCFAGYTTIQYCVIKNNVSTGGNGGGVGSLNGGGNFKVDYCVISGNKAVEGGGTYGRGNISNCLISNNTATQSGGGVYCSNKIVNSTIVRNKARTEGAGIVRSYTLSNSIVWGNVTTNGTSSNISGNITCSYSAIDGGYSGNNNITLSAEATSLFVNPSMIAGVDDTTYNVDWHLKLGSECINRGNNSVVTDSLDLDGTTRIKRDTVDLGCFESDYYGVPAAEYDSIIYVTVTGAGTHSGNSWANAISTIEGAQAIAQTHNAVVWVAVGTYSGDVNSTSENVFTMREGISVYGGFAGNEPSNYDLSLRDFETNSTVLDGRNSRRVLYQAAAFNTTTTWDGFTIRNGKTSGSGAGAYMLKRSVLANCKIEDNNSTRGNGGGVYCSSASVENCEIVRNACQSGGGGIYAYNSTVYGCNIEYNRTSSSYSSDYGGGGICASSSTVRDCNIAYNISNNISGGGVYSYSSNIVSCRISHNQSSYNGGGIYISSNTQVRNCLVDNNTAGTTSSSYGNYGGGGISGRGTFVNTTIVCNTATGDGAGVNGNASTTLRNCIVWGNLRNGSSNNLSGSSIVCSYSAIEGGYVGDSIVVLNFENLPLFVNPSLTAGANDSAVNVDWHLQQGSPCINVGNNTLVTDSLDLDGTMRIKRDTVDLGCYESDYYSVPMTVYDGIIYVTQTGAGDHSGNSWANAISSIEEAQALAQTYGAVVWVAAGTYYGDTTAENAFTMLEGVNVYGGFAGNEPANYDLSQRDLMSNKTILDGRNERQVLWSNHFSTATLWDGFIIQHGRSYAGAGVGLFTNAQINHCKIMYNSCTGGGGGGVYAEHGSVSNCLIANNTANWGGGLVSLSSSVVNSTIVRNSSDNSGVYGDGFSTFTNCIIWGNEYTNGLPSNLVGSAICSFSAIEGDYAGDSIIVLNNMNPPRFVNPSLTAGASDSTLNVDWHLQQGSPCINVGDNTAVTDSLDLDGTARIQRDTVDLGCYESDYYSVPVAVYDSIIYVTVTGAGTRSGNSWANATPSIEEAQSLAFTHNAVVWVAAGTYYGDTTAANAFTMKDGVNVYGGFAGDEPANYDLSLRDFMANETILDGDSTRRVLNQPNDFNTKTVWDGFTIRNGWTSGNGGGANLLRRGVLNNSYISNNTAFFGGGIHAKSSVVSNCTIYHNTATASNPYTYSLYGGGGLYVTSTTVYNCKIDGNMSRYNGGGISVGASTVYNCQITNNTARKSGGGVEYSGGTICSCVVSNNKAVESNGGGVSGSATIRNCLVSNNTSGYYGGGVYSAHVENSTIVRNSAASAGGGIYSLSSAGLINSIVWGNEKNGSSDNIGGPGVTCTYSAVEGGYDGEGNIPLDKCIDSTLFVKPSLMAGASDTTADVDWHLQQGSFCVNRGNNSAVTDSLDLDGTARIKRDTVDMGCYESDYFSAPITVYDSIIYVTVTGAGTHSGNSWANALSSIEDAQALAVTYNAVVWVAAGTYYGDTTADNAFTMVDGVSVYGGFAGNEPADYDLSLRDFEANATILDGMNARRVLYQPFEFNGRTVWNGFTIRNGQTSGDGAGAYLRRNAVLSQCRVQGNVSSSSISGGGGGVYCNNASVDKCNVYGNTSLYNGGGVYATNSTVSDCRIERNAVSNHYPNPQYYGGGGIRASSSTITGCRIKGNQSAVAGGGVFSSGAVLSGCEILENTAVNRGGGINLTSSNSRVTDCLVGNNTATNVGGGISGGGMVVNTTIVRNTSTGDGAGVNGTSSATQITLTNCIVWGNERNGTPDNIRGNLTCSYSAIEGGHVGDSIIVLNNINPPLFVNPSLTAGATDTTANVDWHLQNGSVCVNRGSNSAVTDSLDLDGTARIKRDTVDLGCYESDFYSVPVLYCTTVYGEFAATACDSYSWNDQVFSHSGDYQQTFPLANGCDSIATLHLTVHHAATTREYLTVCASDLPYLYGDTLLDISTPQSLIISSQRQTQYGCDSTVILFLTVTPSTVGNFAAMTPTNNYPVSAYPIRFTWDAVENASNYDLYVWPVGEPQPQQPTASHIHGTSYTLSSLANRGAYQWLMTAYNACDTSESAIRQFTLNVTPTLTVNTSNPVDFGEVALNSASSIFFQVRGTALDSAITYQITGTDASAFSLVPTTSWDSLSGGRMQLTFYPQTIRNEYVAQMTFRSDTLVRTFNVKGYLSDYLTFTTYVDSNVYATDSDIPVHGRVTNPLNEPVAGLDVEVYVKVLDYVRTYPATTDANGQFTIIFTPQHSEAGYYTVGSRRLGGSSTAVHDDFNIPGMMLASSDWILWTPTIDQPDSGTIAVRNRSQIPLTNIQVMPLSLPNGCTVHFDPLNLAGMATGNLTYTVSGSQVSTGVNYEEVSLAAVSDEGAAMSFSAWYYCIPQRADLDVTPTSLTTTMTRGRSKIVDFKIYNNGTGPTGNIFVSLPNLPWMSVVGSDTLPSLAVHDSAYVSIRLIADSADLIRYTGNFAINCERGEGVSVPYSITAISDSTGTLVVDVTDEYTWNTNNGHGPHLAGANVTVKGYYSLETVATGVTDSNGLFTVSDLPEGYYKLIVRADRHEEYQGVLEIVAGDTNRQDIFIQFQAITYSWDVVPTEIEDEYTYELNVEFETHVPKPVIVMEIDRDLTLLDNCETAEFNVVATNHGLVAAMDFSIIAPQSDYFVFTPLISHIDSFPAQTTYVIPVTYQRKDCAELQYVNSPVSRGISGLRNSRGGSPDYYNGIKCQKKVFESTYYYVCRIYYWETVVSTELRYIDTSNVRCEEDPRIEITSIGAPNLKKPWWSGIVEWLMSGGGIPELTKICDTNLTPCQNALNGILGCIPVITMTVNPDNNEIEVPALETIRKASLNLSEFALKLYSNTISQKTFMEAFEAAYNAGATTAEAIAAGEAAVPFSTTVAGLTARFLSAASKADCIINGGLFNLPNIATCLRSLVDIPGHHTASEIRERHSYIFEFV